MKKFYVFAVACVGLLATACGGNKTQEEAVDTTPVQVEEVVVEEVNADSVAPDSVQVEEAGAAEAAVETPAN